MDIKEKYVESVVMNKPKYGTGKNQKQIISGNHFSNKPCEMCVGYEGIKRPDNIYVCEFCEDVYPIKD